VKKMFVRLALGLSALAVASVAVVAQDVMTNRYGQAILTKAPPVTIRRPYRQDPKLKTIYTNLGSGSDVYNSTEGWTVSGFASSEGLWIQGSSFTPAANHTVTEIQVGFTWDSGSPNNGTIALYADRSGVPGKVLHTYKAVNNLPAFGSTGSVLQTVKYAKGTKVKKGTQYWVVLSAPDDTVDVWNYNYNNTEGNEAYNNGQGWNIQISYLGAFAVLGK
jgi:hypothetical protein